MYDYTCSKNLRALIRASDKMATDIGTIGSPFEGNDNLQNYCRKVFVNNEILDEDLIIKKENLFRKTMKMLTTPPEYTTLRVNTLKMNIEELRDNVLSEIKIEEVVLHPSIRDMLIIPSPQNKTMDSAAIIEKQVIVDAKCGAAVLRGAHVYVPGVMAAFSSMKVGDDVSVFADIEGTCRKGFTKCFTGKKVFVGNGIAKVSREEIFSSGKLSGIAIEITQPLFHCPSLSAILLEHIFPQNLPSIVCGHVLSPKPGDRILDMCAAPGGKTSHLATLMENKGLVIALDKTSKKVDKIMDLCNKWGITCVETRVFDGTKCWDSSLDGQNLTDINHGPPFASNSFDKVLLDAPCSALGQRPQFQNLISIPQLKSYIPLQRKLFRNAVGVLRKGGVLVYSTCTLTLEENEGLVKWALDTFPNLQLEKQEPHLGSSGMQGCSLTAEQLEKLQRFPAESDQTVNLPVEADTIGFFIAKFSKI